VSVAKLMIRPSRGCTVESAGILPSFREKKRGKRRTCIVKDRVNVVRAMVLP